ncbi:DUF58 domain-containing protein [Evansella sp. AB-rgal1]|uniref:DUF58 domain-containing protein n=1 Tax=Evansella sp. AB-rgal1 TaxID=3242696 RepID=UPI00359CE521
MGIQWFIIFTVLIILFQRTIFDKLALRNIKYTRYFSQEAVFEGETVEMIEEIVNQKVLPVPWLRLESKFSSHLQFKQQSTLEIVDNQFHRSLFSLMPYQKVTRRHYITAEKRGHYWQNFVTMSSGDPFGLVIKKQEIDVSADIYIYPQLVPIEDIPLPSTSWQGDITVRRWIMEDPFIIAGVREYSTGDPMKSVNWNATARTNSLQVSKMDYTSDHHLMIYVNFDLTEDIWMPIKDEAIIEKAISYAASIAQHSIEQGIGTGFGCNSYIIEPDEEVKRIKHSVRVEPGSGQDQLQYIFQTMAKVKMDRSMNFNSFLGEDISFNRKDTDILIITVYVTETMEQQIRELESNGNSIEVLLLNDTVTDEIGDNHD